MASPALQQFSYPLEARWHVLEVHLQQVPKHRPRHRAWWVAGSLAPAPMCQVHQKQEDNHEYGHGPQFSPGQHPHGCPAALWVSPGTPLGPHASHLGPGQKALAEPGHSPGLAWSLVKDPMQPFALCLKPSCCIDLAECKEVSKKARGNGSLRGPCPLSPQVLRQVKGTGTQGNGVSLAYWSSLAGRWELHGQMTDVPPAQTLGQEEECRQHNLELWGFPGGFVEGLCWQQVSARVALPATGLWDQVSGRGARADHWGQCIRCSGGQEDGQGQANGQCFPGQQPRCLCSWKPDRAVGGRGFASPSLSRYFPGWGGEVTELLRLSDTLELCPGFPQKSGCGVSHKESQHLGG